MNNELSPNFLCQCGHRNKMHASKKDSLEGYAHDGRMCVEYKSWPYPSQDEQICLCDDFTPDNLKTLEMMQKPTIEINPFLGVDKITNI